MNENLDSTRKSIGLAKSICLCRPFSYSGPWSTNDDGAYFKAALLSGPPGIGTIKKSCHSLILNWHSLLFGPSLLSACEKRHYPDLEYVMTYSMSMSKHFVRGWVDFSKR